MKSSRYVIAFSGLIVFSGGLFSSADALAFGQQWRPAQAYGPSYAPHYQRVANMPNFRPSLATRPARLAARPQQARRTSWGAYRGASRGLNRATAYYPAAPMPAAYRHWGQPQMAMVRPMQQQVPYYARQFAWRPSAPAQMRYQQARQPLQAQQPTYGVRVTPVNPGFRPHGGYAQLAPVMGGWRPATQSLSARSQRYAQPAPTYRRASRSAYPAVAGNWPAARPNFVTAPAVRAAVPAGGQWRPSLATAQTNWQVDRSFRPAGYGKSKPAERLLTDNLAGSAARALPGWVTTYQDSSASADACYWCNGS